VIGVERTPVGTWRLASWVGTSADGTVIHPLGEAAVGMLLLTEDGWFSGQASTGQRHRSTATSPFAVPDDEAAEMAKSYVAYCGTYEIEGNRAIFTGSVSLFPNWVGVRQVRTWHFDGDVLVLQQQPPQEVDGTTYVFELRWHPLTAEVVDSMGL
jgi:hypothetical protein